MTVRTRLWVALLLIASVVIIGSAGFRYIEGWSWFEGLYMTLITMTTVGYGEIHPLSHSGRVFNAILILAAVTAGGFLLAAFTQALLEFELGKFFGRRRMERELAKLTHHYIICGAGRVGRTVARELSLRGVPCLVVEKDPARAQWAVNEGIPVIVGNAANEDILQRARIEQARGLVSAVTTDAENLYIVLTASGMRPSLPIIARASEEEATSKLLRAGASRVLSPYHFIGNRIVQLLLRPHVLDFIDTAFGVERMDIQIEEVRVAEKSSLAGQSLSSADIRRKSGVLILALKRSEGAMEFNPAPDAVIQAGDHLIAIGSAEHLKKLEALAGG